MRAAISLEPKAEINLLYRIEFGEVTELSFRMIGSLFGALILWLYTSWLLAFVWIGSFAVCQASYFLFLRSRLGRASGFDVIVAKVSLVAVLASYAWMPVLMLSSADGVLCFAGFCLLSCMIVFVVRRSAQSLTITLSEIAVLSIFLFVGGFRVILRSDDPLAWLGISFAYASVVIYLIQGAYIVRRQAVNSIEVAVRSGQAEKLEAIGKLASGVAHDFNNLLTAIIGNLDLMDEVSDPEVRSELRAEARSAAVRGAQVVRQLLNYARQTEYSPRQIDVATLLKAVTSLCKTLVPSSVTLRTSVPSRVLFLYVDEAAFVTAILNLVKNSADAIESSGTIAISVVEKRLEKPLQCATGMLALGEYIAIIVTDDGSGISSSVLPRVTDPFFTTKVVGKGSGLGLSMVSGFALKSGGGLEIKSSEQGTMISVLFPRCRPEI